MAHSDGRNLDLTMAGTAVPFAISKSLRVGKELIDTNNADSDWATALEGTRNWGAQFEVLIDDTTGLTKTQVLGWASGSAPIAITFWGLEGDAHVDDAEIIAETNSAARINVSLTGNGLLNETV